MANLKFYPWIILLVFGLCALVSGEEENIVPSPLRGTSPVALKPGNTVKVMRFSPVTDPTAYLNSLKATPKQNNINHPKVMRFSPVTDPTAYLNSLKATSKNNQQTNIIKDQKPSPSVIVPNNEPANRADLTINPQNQQIFNGPSKSDPRVKDNLPNNNSPNNQQPKEHVPLDRLGAKNNQVNRNNPVENVPNSILNDGPIKQPKIAKVFPPMDNPILNQPVKPFVDQPVNPILNQPVKPVVDQPVNPALNQPVKSPLNDKSFTPVENVPASSFPDAPMKQPKSSDLFPPTVDNPLPGKATDPIKPVFDKPVKPVNDDFVPIIENPIVDRQSFIPQSNAPESPLPPPIAPPLPPRFLNPQSPATVSTNGLFVDPLKRAEIMQRSYIPKSTDLNNVPAALPALTALGRAGNRIKNKGHLMPAQSLGDALQRRAQRPNKMTAMETREMVQSMDHESLFGSQFALSPPQSLPTRQKRRDFVGVKENSNVGPKRNPIYVTDELAYEFWPMNRMTGAKVTDVFTDNRLNSLPSHLYWGYAADDPKNLINMHKYKRKARDPGDEILVVDDGRNKRFFSSRDQ